MDNYNYTDSIAKAEHFIAIGKAEVYLHETPPDDFFKYVIEIKEGGLHRMDLCVSLSLIAQHPCGLRFRWHFDLESKEANGSGYYQFDKEAILGLMRKLPAPMRNEMRLILARDSDIIQQKADEIYGIYLKQEADAALLRGLLAA